ncbi:hypothetical protein RJ639_017379 [Escallonia herrerae]|uniref:Uncharacterized protein n=1 Tax=Escallonia herrerae TaxID=1293975 RepID=A0AA88VEZ0_9ASTE|nr:hypothetical protein RJ639_017379 [Escallonia herrerae]
MNPARSIGPAIVSGEFHHLWVYIVAPVLGTMTACGIYSLLRLPINDNHNPRNKGSSRRRSGQNEGGAVGAPPWVGVLEASPSRLPEKQQLPEEIEMNMKLKLKEASREE